MALLDVEDLTFSYPGCERPALARVSLQVEEGSLTCLVGSSGSGKTTLLRHLKSVLTPHGRRSGRVRLEGQPLAEVGLRDQSRLVGFVLQDPSAQIVTDEPWHELAFGLESLEWDPAAMRRRVAEMASWLSLEPWLHRRVSELSGGQRQLLSLASALALEPKLLVLDEPTSSLDPVAADELLGAVRKVNRELGVAVVLAEHRLEGVYGEADQVVAMEAGRVVAAGPPRAVAERLQGLGSPLARALPAPLRIYQGVTGAAKPASMAGATDGEGSGSGSDGPVAASADGRGALPPLTVREGRRWLASYAKAHGLASTGAPSPDEGHGPGPAESAADGAPGEAATPAGAIASAALSNVNASAERTTTASVGITAPSGPAEASPQPATAPARDVALRARDLWLRYDRDSPDVLRGASLTVRRGEVLALVGGNGAGKSTLLRALCGIQRPYRGRVEVLGWPLRAWKGQSLFQGAAALLPQDPRDLFAADTVAAELEEMLEDGPLNPEQRRERIARVMADCELEGLEGRHPFDLSGGEQQRVALAKALLRDPEVLLLDEPTKGLDALRKDDLAALLRQQVDRGATVVMASHDIEFCAQHATTVALLFDGAIAASGIPQQFFAGNLFYTTAASRMSRGVLDGAVTVEEVVARCAPS